MAIRSTSPIAEEPVSQNDQKAAAVQLSLNGLGFASASYKISSVVFGQGGGPRLPGQIEITAYEAIEYVMKLPMGSRRKLTNYGS